MISAERESKTQSLSISVSLSPSLSRILSHTLSFSLPPPPSHPPFLRTPRSAAAKKWTAPSGYVPGGSQTVSRPVDAAPRSSAPSSYAGNTGVSTQSPEMTSAPAKTWQPYGGYEPKRDRPATPAPAAPLSSAPAPTLQMTSGMHVESDKDERENERET